ncbi:MAG TPA: pyridoxal-phosphate dependent enzyme [Streptosporangiaceae bacterium]|jgi:threonine dehydratase
MVADPGTDAAASRPAGSAAAALPVTPAVAVSDHLWLKLESFQPTGSFKVRGFLSAVGALSDADLAAGIVTVSAGNAALAAAYTARRLGIGCTVVMYDTAPAAKRDGVLALGAEVLAWPRERVLSWMAERGWESMPQRFVHPFADPAVIAGHGSLARELLDQVPQARRVIVAVGGGGLAAGVGTVLHQAGRDVEVVGAQSSGYPLWLRTFADGAPPALSPDTIADGTTAPYDPAMHERLRSAVDRWVEVPEPALRAAVAELALGHKVVAEGAGALAYAATLQLADQVPAVAVVSGGNIDGARLAELLTAG